MKQASKRLALALTAFSCGGRDVELTAPTREDYMALSRAIAVDLLTDERRPACTGPASTEWIDERPYFGCVEFHRRIPDCEVAFFAYSSSWVRFDLQGQPYLKCGTSIATGTPTIGAMAVAAIAMWDVREDSECRACGEEFQAFADRVVLRHRLEFAKRFDLAGPVPKAELDAAAHQKIP